MDEKIREGIQASMLGLEIGKADGVQCTWSDNGVLIRDANNRSFMSLDNYLGSLCVLEGKQYTSMTLAQRELLSFVLGSLIEPGQQFVVPGVENG